MFTPEQDGFILMAHFRSGTQSPDGKWTYSLESCYLQFMKAFPDSKVRHSLFGHHKREIVKRFDRKHCICKGKSTGRPTVLTEPVLNDIQETIKHNPNESLRKISALTGMSRGTCSKALETFKKKHKRQKNLELVVPKIEFPENNKPLLIILGPTNEEELLVPKNEIKEEPDDNDSGSY